MSRRADADSTKGEAGNSSGMLLAFETINACKRGCALQGRQGGATPSVPFC
jgi:hypothetical protein